MDLERFVTAQDCGGTFRHGDRVATLSCERRLRRRVQSAMRERLENMRSMINLDGALQSMAYTEHCLANDQHRRTTVAQDPDNQGVRIVPGHRPRKWSAETFSAVPGKSHSLGIAADAPNGR